jgi:L-asparaginase
MRPILILHTGGTIGMQPGDRGLQPDPDFAGKLQAYLAGELIGNSANSLPVDIATLPPIDSANLQPEHWQKIGQALLSAWDEHAGFVVLHGTDTLAWSAAALSFMLQGTDKPVVFSGAQIPLHQPGSDAPANLRLALLAAAQPQLKEVCIAFGGRLLRGNRARKIGAQNFAAFASPNYPDLGTLNADGSVAFHVEHFLLPSRKRFRVPQFLPHAVAMLPLYPGISAHGIQALLASPGLRALVLQSYGAGNVPEADTAFIDSLRAARQNGILLANTTQCPRGHVAQGTYATSHILDQLGVIPLADITPEAAYAKLNFLLASEGDIQRTREKLACSLAGELSSWPRIVD